MASVGLTDRSVMRLEGLEDWLVLAMGLDELHEEMDE